MIRTRHHLRDPRFRDSPAEGRSGRDASTDPDSASRLSWYVPDEGEISWPGLAEAVLRNDVAVFADSSLFDDRTPSLLWEALGDSGRLHLTSRVRQELEPWLGRRADPLVRDLVRSVESNSAEDARTAREHPIALSYYLSLLMMRRRLFTLERLRLADELGREPADDEVRARVPSRTGERGYLIGNKGDKEQRGKEHDLQPTDEEVVVRAVAHSITTGQPSVILTKDHDLPEQFYKLIWLVDTHYRAMLFADIVAASPDAFEMSVPAPSTRGLAEMFVELTLVRKPPSADGLVLPPDPHPVSITCLLVGDQVSELTFVGEMEMSRLLNVKNDTGGLNTTALDGRNLHYWLAPLDLPEQDRGCAGIAIDRRVELRGGDDLRLSSLDMHQVLLTLERRRPFRGTDEGSDR